MFASEPASDRLGVLRANLKRTGSMNTATVKSVGQDLPFPDCSWDYIQLDPPCSGWGTVEKNPKIREQWGEGRTSSLVALQKQLLRKAAAMLAPGGSVLFSTCTTNIEENEEQVAWALGELDLELERLEPPSGFVFSQPLLPGVEGVLRVADDSEGQGFFLARFRKRAGNCAHPVESVQKKALPGTRLNLKRMQGGEGVSLDNLPPGQIYEFGSKVFFLHEQAIRMVPDSLRWQGALLGKVVGKGGRASFRPDGMVKALLPAADGSGAPDRLVVEEVAPVEKLFSGQSLTFSPGKGPVALYYRGLPLCWLARKGKRLILSSK